jgi:hypothetical protein
MPAESDAFLIVAVPRRQVGSGSLPWIPLDAKRVTKLAIAVRSVAKKWSSPAYIGSRRHCSSLAVRPTVAPAKVDLRTTSATSPA